MNAQSTSPSAVALGLPEWLRHLQNRVFETLPEHEAEQFAKDFIAANPVNADIERVLSIITIARLERCKIGSEDWGNAYREQVLAAIDGVIDLYLSKRRTSTAADSAAGLAWSAAGLAAESVQSARSAAGLADLAAHSAYWTARSAYWTARSAHWAAGSATDSAARSADSAAGLAVDLAAYSAAYSTERSARLEAWRIERDVLLDALRQCKGPA